MTFIQIHLKYKNLQVRYRIVKIFIIIIVLLVLYSVFLNIYYFHATIDNVSSLIQERYNNLGGYGDNGRYLEPTDQQTVNIENDYDDSSELFKKVKASLRNYENNRQQQQKYDPDSIKNKSDYLLDDDQRSQMVNDILKLFNKFINVKYNNNIKNVTVTSNLVKNGNNRLNSNQLINIELFLNEFMKYLSNNELNNNNPETRGYMDDNYPDNNNNNNKVSIKFRSTNIYRIDLNCFWTKTLSLYKVYNYKYDRSIANTFMSRRYCTTNKRKPIYIEHNMNKMIEIVKYLNEMVKVEKITPFDNLFLSQLKVKPLINGGGWYPNFHHKFYEESNNYANIFDYSMSTRCIPKERVAILIAMKDRLDNLNTVLIYLHYFLQQQQKSYKIFVIEQANNVDSGVLFNKGRLYNIGYKHVIKDLQWQFNCIILHDIDLLPLNLNLDYSCDDMPKHMSINIRRMTDNSLSPHYKFLTGGVLSLRPEHFETLNGYSNQYFGWGGEDDDLTIRIIEKELCVLRPSRNISNYVMLPHKRSVENEKRWELIMTATNRIDRDGLSNIEQKAKILSIRKHKKFTHLLANVAIDFVV